MSKSFHYEKKKMQFLKQTGKSIDTQQEQLIELPLAIGDHEWNL